MEGANRETTQQADGRPDLRRQLRALDERVDRLQATLEERRRPWYRRFSDVVSVIALALAVAGVLYGHRAKSAEDLRLKREELRGALAQLVALRAEIFDRLTSGEEAKERRAVSQMLNAKRLIYLEAAESLASEFPEQVSSAEYNVLANEAAMDARFDQAERYFARAVRASRGGVARAVALRTLAVFYLGPGPLRSFEKGRRHFQEAVDVLVGATDSHSLLALGTTYEAWGQFEQRYGSEREASQRFEMARKAYSEMPPDPLRDRALELLQSRTALESSATR